MPDTQHPEATSSGGALAARGNLRRSSLSHVPTRPIALLAMLLLATLFLSGCFYSLQPFYTDKDTFFVPELIGTWQDPESAKDCEKYDMDRETTVTFTQSGDQAYDMVINTLTFTKSGGPPCVLESKEAHRFEAHLVKLGGLVMLDAYPSDARSRLDDEQLLPVHSILRIELRPDGLRIIPWNYEYLDERLRHGKLKIAHTQLKDAIPGSGWFGPWDAILVTATTADLQKRLIEIESDPKVFSEKDAAEFRRQETNGPTQ